MQSSSKGPAVFWVSSQEQEKVLSHLEFAITDLSVSGTQTYQQRFNPELVENTDTHDPASPLPL